MMAMGGRRQALQALGLGLATVGIGVTGGGSARVAEGKGPLLAPNGKAIRKLMDPLAAIPRRRDFKTVPMILDDPSLWDHAALDEVL